MIADYINGNVHITLDDDGTRIMECPDNEVWDFEYPTNIDMTITKSCTGRCQYCYLGCTPDGKHADLLSNRNIKIFDSLLPGTEVAINLNSCNHPQLFPFLNIMKAKGIVVSGTVNQIHFMDYYQVLKELCDAKWLYGLGISLQKPTEEFIRRVKLFPNAIIHVINGIVTENDIKMLQNRGLQLLILGYKNIGRGRDFKEENEVILRINQNYLYKVLQSLPNLFDTISFDNNALSQLDAKRLVPEDKWDEFYQGDEGSCSFYIDLVDQKFGISSTELPENMMPLMDNVKDMFGVIKKKARGE